MAGAFIAQKMTVEVPLQTNQSFVNSEAALSPRRHTRVHRRSASKCPRETTSECLQEAEGGWDTGGRGHAGTQEGFNDFKKPIKKVWL